MSCPQARRCWPGIRCSPWAAGGCSKARRRSCFASFRRFDALPDETLLCCGHEYTEGNLRFALHLSPGDPALLAAAARIAARRAAGQPTVPTTLGEERALNPFLRAPDAATLGKLRALKDAFRG